MTLQELKEQAIALSVDQRLELISAIALSVKDASQPEAWQFLESRPESWKEQLFIKGRKLPASIVWGDRIVNEMTLAEAADNWDLPIEAVQEAIRYCESHRKLLLLEAESERAYLEREGVSLEPASVSR